MEEREEVLLCSLFNNTLRVEEDENDRDRLSDLPDDVFYKIISFLDIDTKTLVQASLLSTRWRYLWLSALNLNFSNKGKPISGLVDNVLRLRKESDIYKLSLSFPRYHCVENIGSWITHAVSRNVQEIHITGVIIRTVVFSELHVKTLKLSHIIINIPKWQDDVLLDLPVTEYLVIDHLSANSFRLLTICAPRLKTLVLDNVRDQPRSIDIRSPYLAVVKSEGFLYQDFLLENVLSLRKAELSIYMNDLFTQVGRVIEVLSVLSNAETLTLSVRDFEDSETISKLLHELKKLERSFGNTRYLEVKSRHNSFSDTELLEVFPNVKTIKRKLIV
ncbi:hypothetical protein ACHQM5_001703 [Ranunculus cassubicifolius]